MRDDVHGVADAAVDHEACTGVAAAVRLPRVRHEEPEIQNFKKQMNWIHQMRRQSEQEGVGDVSLCGADGWVWSHRKITVL
jgi:hypothetical protein